jgi:hypothetical protein
MLKQNVQYVDFNGNKKEKTIYLNMTRREAITFLARNGINASNKGGEGVSEQLNKKVNALVKKGDVKTMLDFIDDLLLSSYGEKSEDGERFIKNDEVRKNFSESLAYQALFDQVLNDPKVTSNIAKGLVSVPI